MNRTITSKGETRFTKDGLTGSIVIDKNGKRISASGGHQQFLPNAGDHPYQSGYVSIEEPTTAETATIFEAIS